MADIFSGFGDYDESAIMLSQADLALSEGQLEAACSYYFKLANEREDTETQEFCHSRIAQCHYRRERWRDCMESAKASISQVDSKVLLSLCLYRKDDDPHSSVSVLEEITGTEKLSEFVKTELNTLLPEIKERAAAEQSVFPKHVAAKVKELKVQGNYQFKTGDFKAASNYYKEGINALEYWRVKLEGNASYKDNPAVREEYFALISVLISNLINCHAKLSNMEGCRGLADKLIEIRPTWKKSYYWSAITYIAEFQFGEAREHFNKCLGCATADAEEISEQLQFVEFCQHNEEKLRGMLLKKRQDLFTVVRKNVSSMSGNSFAASMTKIYSDNSTHWHMTSSALVNQAGHITNFIAPKYEASEKDRNLLNEMKRDEKKKLFVHLTQSKEDSQQIVGFSETDALSAEVKEILSVLETELNTAGQFNCFVKNYLK